MCKELLTQYLFLGGAPFAGIVGEEDNSIVNILRRPYQVDNLEVPVELFEEIDNVREQVAELGKKIDVVQHGQLYSKLTLFIDPIDGTKEFASGLGEQCTILIGVAENGTPVAGVIYRPIPLTPLWAIGCKRENFTADSLDRNNSVPTTSNEVNTNMNGNFLTTNGTISPYVGELVESLGMNRLRGGGVGNKVMNLLEGKGDCYIQVRCFLYSVILFQSHNI